MDEDPPFLFVWEPKLSFIESEGGLFHLFFLRIEVLVFYGFGGTRAVDEDPPF